MKKLLALSALSVATVGLTACSSSSDISNVSYQGIVGNLTPELETLDQRPVDSDTALSVAINQDLRMMREDIGRAMYWDHPSRLSPYPILDTSGKPR